MARKLPSYTQDNLTQVGKMTSQISAAAARYGVPPEAIAGALAQELFDQKDSLTNYARMVGSAVFAREFLDRMFIEGKDRNPSHPTQGASDIIRDRYNADPDATTVGRDLRKKFGNPLLVDYGPAGMKFQNAIRAILNNPDDPALEPYVKDLYSAGVALQKGSNQALMASTIGAYLREGARNYQSNMSVNDDLKTGVDAWERLDPSTRNALLVQFYKQGPTPRLAQEKMTLAAEMGAPYVPQIGADGAGATYLANEAAIIRALAEGPASFSDRWNATNDGTRRVADQRSVSNPAGGITDPAAYADVQGRGDPNPGPPAYIPEYLRYLQSADRVPWTRPEAVRILRRMPAGESDRSAFNSSDGVPVPFIPPDASFPLSPQGDFERRFGSGPPPSGGVLGGFNRAQQGQPDIPDNEDWSAMWRRRPGLP
jgi:hypothetical protein